MYLVSQGQFTSVNRSYWEKESSTVDAVVKCLKDSTVPQQVCHCPRRSDVASGVVMRWTCAQWVVGSIFTGTWLRNNLGQAVYICVPLSPSSISWYWSKHGDVLRLGR